MTPATLIRRNITRRKARLFLTIVAVAVAFLLFGVMNAVRQNFTLGATNENATRLIVSNKIGDFEPLPISYVDQVRATPGVLAASMRSFVLTHFQDPKNRFLTLAVEPGSYLDTYPDYVLDRADREAFLKDRTSVIVGETLATRFNWKKGDVVPLVQRLSLDQGGEIVRQMRIAGIFKGNGPEVGTGLALSHYSTFNEARMVQKDTVGAIILRTSHPSVNDAVIASVDKRFANSAHETKTMTEEAFSRALLSQIGDISLVTTLVIAAGFFAILLIVGSSMASSIRERSREIGILRSLGFMPQRILTMILTESVIISLIGGFIGMFGAKVIVAGIRVSDAATFGRMALTSSSFGISMLLMVAFGILVALLPALRALNGDVTTALTRR